MDMSLMFSVSGLRGIVGKDLFPETIARYAAHFGRFVGRGTIVIGRDTRVSGRKFRKAVILGLHSVGCKVIDLGVVPTPTVVHTVRKLRARGGIAVTASHNPSQWNALKFVSSRGQFLNRQEFRRFLRLAECRTIDRADTEITEEPDIQDRGAEHHIDAIIRTLDIRSADLRVGVDAVNGAGSIVLPELLHRMGCKVFKIHCEPRPKFPRPPEPVAAHLSALRRLVQDRNLDLGVACDPDADRLACIDEKGRAIGEEKTLVLAADYVLRRTKRPIVTNLSTTALIDDIAGKHGVDVLRTPVGEAHVVSKMMQVKAGIGGEGNGGVIYPRINYTRDALVAAALVVKMMTRQDKKLSEICAAYPEYFMIKTKLPVSGAHFERRKKKLLRIMKGRVNQRDGLKITAQDYWVHVRPSQTEPLVRIICEASNEKIARRHVAQIKNILR
jgi:phosphomannomutase